MGEYLHKELTYEVIGACMEVHRVLGRGFLEPVYQEALERELVLQEIPHEREKELKITYKGDQLNKTYSADFMCYDKLIVEVKALLALSSTEEAQLLNYLKATDQEIGLLVNFGEKSLNYKRFIQ